MKRVEVVLISASLMASGLAYADAEPESTDPAPADEVLLAQEGDDSGSDDGAGDETDDEVVEDAEVAEESGGGLPIGISLSAGLSSSVRTIGNPGSTNILAEDDGSPRLTPEEVRGLDDGTYEADTDYAASDGLASSFGLNLSYPLPVEQSMSLSLGWSYTKYLTRAGGLNGTYEGRASDIAAGFAWRDFYVIPGADIHMSMNAGLTAPTSRTSSWSELRTTASLGLGLSRSFGNFRISYSVRGAKNFHASTSIVNEPSGDIPGVGSDSTSEPLPFVARDEEVLGDRGVHLGLGVLSSHSLSNSLSLSYSWLDALSTSMTVTLSNSWRYNPEGIRDNEGCTTGTSDGVSDCVAFYANDQNMSSALIGVLSQSYSFLTNYSLTLAFATAGGVFNSRGDNRVRFPLWDAEGNGSYTQASLTFAASF